MAGALTARALLLRGAEVLNLASYFSLFIAQSTRRRSPLPISALAALVLFAAVNLRYLGMWIPGSALLNGPVEGLTRFMQEHDEDAPISWYFNAASSLLATDQRFRDLSTGFALVSRFAGVLALALYRSVFPGGEDESPGGGSKKGKGGGGVVSVVIPALVVVACAPLVLSMNLDPHRPQTWSQLAEVVHILAVAIEVSTHLTPPHHTTSHFSLPPPPPLPQVSRDSRHARSETLGFLNLQVLGYCASAGATLIKYQSKLEAMSLETILTTKPLVYAGLKGLISFQHALHQQLYGRNWSTIFLFIAGLFLVAAVPSSVGEWDAWVRPRGELLLRFLSHTYLVLLLLVAFAGGAAGAVSFVLLLRLLGNIHGDFAAPLMAGAGVGNGRSGF